MMATLQHTSSRRRSAARRLARAAWQHRRPGPCAALVFLVALALGTPARAEDRVVTDDQQVAAALAAAQPGDRILLAPGDYRGGLFRDSMSGVTIRSQDPVRRARLIGGTHAIQLSNATNVTIEELICAYQTGNGINIDDGGSLDSPSTDITIRNVVIQYVRPGNRDGIKFSGVTGFLIEGVRIDNWGDGGSAIDMVGAHHGLIQNSFLRHTAGAPNVSGIRPKGGSKDIVVRANRIQIDGNVGRALQAGGVTEAPYFRFIDGDSGYEAADITFEGNVVLGAGAPFSFANIDGGLIHHNYAFRPRSWMLRILNENRAEGMVGTLNGRLHNNVLVYADFADEYVEDVNIGPATMPETFSFVGNLWHDMADPSHSAPTLPSEETGARHGGALRFRHDDAIPWTFDWGIWGVNAVDVSNLLTLKAGAYERGTPGEGASFDPLLSEPFIGEWTFEPVTSPKIWMPAFSQVYLRKAARAPRASEEGR